MENESFDAVVGNTSAPYLTQLAHGCGLAVNYTAIAHPSLPNYLAATSGDTWGVTDDGPPAAHPIRYASIFSQVAAAGKAWRSYEESMPSNCDRSSSGEYAVKHNPAAYYTAIRATCLRWDVPLSAFRVTRLPAFSFVTPNLCNDMHDCPVTTGGRWLARFVPKLLASNAYRSGSTVLFITFDEGTDAANHVATIVVSPATRPGTRASERFDHYSLLKTTEQLLGLRREIGHAVSARSMRAAFGL